MARAIPGCGGGGGSLGYAAFYPPTATSRAAKDALMLLADASFAWGPARLATAISVVGKASAYPFRLPPIGRRVPDTAAKTAIHSQVASRLALPTMETCAIGALVSLAFVAARRLLCGWRFGRCRGSEAHGTVVEERHAPDVVRVYHVAVA